jgi:hypothetical protein
VDLSGEALNDGGGGKPVQGADLADFLEKPRFRYCLPQHFGIARAFS